MINYAIPGAFEMSNLNFKLLDLKRRFPDYFYPDINIEITYGNPQFCIWDGGRIFSSYNQMSLTQVQDIINIYNNEFKIPIRYVFTNCCLTEKEYHNRFGNLLMESGNSGLNEVVIADDDFMHYLKNKYPMYKFVSSTTKVLKKPEEAKQELNKEDYKLVCLHYDLNFNFKFLNSLNEKERTKTEFLINPICPPGCQFRKHHYYLNSQGHLNFGKVYSLPECAVTTNCLDPRIIKLNHMTYEMIKEKYVPLNFEHYKIEGRTWKESDLALTYVAYMVKPEWQAYVANYLLSYE